jgi:hypothetical protein
MYQATGGGGGSGGHLFASAKPPPSPGSGAARPTHRGAARHEGVGLFSFAGFFLSPHALVGWARRFFIFNFVSQPQQYKAIGLAYFSFFKSEVVYDFFIATKKSNELT